MDSTTKYHLNSVDTIFDDLLQKKYRDISKIHWTPIEIIEQVVLWFSSNRDAKILDIGSGVGKFCIVGAMITDLEFVGVEKRNVLIKEAVKIKKELNLKNINFVNSNVLDFDFDGFNSFYYYNPFCEQIAEYDLIDNTIDISADKYIEYEDYVVSQLKKANLGSKLVTYCSPNFSPPPSFMIKDMKYEGELVFWEKTKEVL